MNWRSVSRDRVRCETLGRFRARPLANLLVALFGSTLLGCGSSKPEGGANFTQQIEQAQQESTPEARARKLAKIGNSQFKTGDLGGAQQTLTLAEQACAEVKDPADKASVLSLLATAQARAGNQLKARDALSAAREATGKIENQEHKAAALTKIGSVTGVELKILDSAKEDLHAATALADQVDPEGKVLLLISISQAYAKLNSKADSDAALAAALVAASEIEDPFKASEAIADVGVIQASRGHTESAKTSFDMALERARIVPKLYSKVFALTVIAEKLTAAGDKEQAATVLDEAEPMLKQITEVDLQGQIEDKIGKTRALLPKKN